VVAGVRPDEALQRSQMHMATWTDLLHMAIERRRRKQRIKNGAANHSGDTTFSGAWRSSSFSW
jgi:hypothetical protein